MAHSNDYRPILRGGLWLAACSAVLATCYGLGANSTIALAIGLQSLLVAAAWAEYRAEPARVGREIAALRQPGDSWQSCSPTRTSRMESSPS